MTYCVVKGCHNSSHTHQKHRKIRFHLFPADPIIAAKWIEKVRLNRKESYWKPTKYTKICSVHFDDKEKYITKGGLSKLRSGAIPTKGLNNFYTEEIPDSKDACNMDLHDSDDTPPLIIVRDDTDLDSILDTSEKPALQRQIQKKILLQRKHCQNVKTLQQKTHCVKKKNFSLHKILINLRSKRFLDNDVLNILSENVYSAELYNKMVKKSLENKNRPMPKYTPQFRKFCLTLNFYSPQAYSYVRGIFDSCLPHPKIIYNWYRNVNGCPGLTDEAFKLLKTKVQYTEKKLICVLVADEMAIRPQNIKGGHGQVNFGIGTSECFTKATEAYTFILVCLNEQWKIPLGYFLVNGLSGVQKCNIIKICLTKCEEVGVKVVALTFDTHITNISAMELLGCNLKDHKNMKTTFKHPAADYNVAVFLDSSHIIKLVQKHFENKKVFFDQDERKVNWGFLTKLNDIQEKEGLHLSNKLTRRYLEFRNSIMKMKLASQLVSRSVAAAIRFCRKVLKLKSFKDSEGTEDFIMTFHNLFDIFNSNSLTEHGFSHPLSHQNKPEIFDYLDKAKKYILNLKIKNTRKRKFSERQGSIQSKIQTFQSDLAVKCSLGFKGLLVCIESLMYLYKTLIEDTQELKYINTYRLSQDHIELFFASIRMHGGHSDNLNALQFKGSYRKLLCRMELPVGETCNCVPLETLSILKCSSALQCINSSAMAERFDDVDEELMQTVLIVEEVTLEIASHDDPDYRNHFVGYIAGNVVKQLVIRIKCRFCLDNMLADEKIWFHKFVCLRDKGGSVYASKEVYSICSVAENWLKSYIKQKAQKSYSEKVLTLKIMAQLIGCSLFPIVEEHIHSHHHDTNLARLIVEHYIRLRLFYEAKKDNMSQIALSKWKLFKKQLQIQ